MKTCTKCNNKKDIGDFYPQKDGVDGVRGDCKLCVNKANRERVAKNPEKKRESDRKYRERPEVKERLRKYSKEYRKEYYIKNRERILSNAKEKQKLKPKKGRDRILEEFRAKEGVKKCSKCEDSKNVSEFYVSKASKDGLQGSCKECYKKRTLKHYHDNFEKISSNRKKTYHKDIDATRAYYRERWSKLSKEKKRQYFLNYINKPGNKEKRTKRWTKRYRTDTYFHLSACLRRRVQMAFKQQSAERKTRTYDLIGCSINDLKKHLESQFKEGMSWENHSRYGWHIDHIRPIASFDISDPEQQKIAFNWKNLQPLWAEENHRKHARY